MIKDARYIIKRVIIGVLISLVLMFLKSNVFALTYGGNLLGVNTSFYDGQTQRNYNNLSTFLYDNYYYSDSKIFTEIYALGFAIQNYPGTTLKRTYNINYFMSNPCGSADNLSYTMNVRFYKMAESDTFNFSNLPVILGNAGCTGTWQQNGDNWDYVLSCNLQPNNYVVGSLTFDYSYLGIPRGVFYHYRVAIQKNFSYTCSINSQTVIQNDNINTQKIIDNNNNNTNKITNSIDNVNNNINDDDVTGASNEGSSFFNNFTSDNHGLTGIITAPLSMIQSITSSSCTPLTLPLPFVNKDLTLPCMSTIYSQYFGTFFQMYQIITFGIISYWVCVKIFALVKGFKDPNDDRIEVLDL